MRNVFISIQINSTRLSSERPLAERWPRLIFYRYGFGEIFEYIVSDLPLSAIPVCCDLRYYACERVSVWWRVYTSLLNWGKSGPRTYVQY